MGVVQESRSLNVLVCGGGFAGLATAIGCARQGFKVTLVERSRGPSPLGDVLGLGPNCGRLAFRWGIGEEMWEKSSQGRYFNLKEYQHGKIFHQEDNVAVTETFGCPMLPGHRSFYHQVTWDLAERLGVTMRTKVAVESYIDDAEQPGIITSTGEKITADVVLAADGIKSKAKVAVLGYDDAPVSSGYAVYRAYMLDSSPIKNDPLCAHMLDGGAHCYVGPDVHAIICSFDHGTGASMSCTHKDTDGAIEDWSAETSIDKVLALLEGWDPALRAAVEKFKTCIDWKLSWRDPLPTWVSKGGRIAIIGDAAHSFLPTSIQGASQAWEDGACVAVALALAGGKSDAVPLALKAFEGLRYDRVKEAQQMGRSQRDKWHKSVENGTIDSDPASLSLSSPKFFDFDVEQNALDDFESVVRKLQGSDSFVLDAKVKEVVLKNCDVEAATKPGGPLSPERLKKYYR